MATMNIPAREVAKKVFASELLDTTLHYKKSTDEKAPGYVLTPTGEEANRLYMTAILTDVEQINTDPIMYRLRLLDPSGRITATASQFKPAALASASKLVAPCFVAMTVRMSISTGRTDGKLYQNINIDTINEVDEATYVAGSVAAYNATVDRIQKLADPANELGQKALQEYHTDIGSYKEMLVRVLEDIEKRVAKPVDAEISVTSEPISKPAETPAAAPPAPAPAATPAPKTAEEATGLKPQVVSKKKKTTS
jgi:RPA family protein